MDIPGYDDWKLASPECDDSEEAPDEPSEAAVSGLDPNTPIETMEMSFLAHKATDPGAPESSKAEALERFHDAIRRLLDEARSGRNHGFLSFIAFSMSAGADLDLVQDAFQQVDNTCTREEFYHYTSPFLEKK